MIKQEKETQFHSITKAYIVKIQALGFTVQEAADKILHSEEEI